MNMYSCGGFSFNGKRWEVSLDLDSVEVVEGEKRYHWHLLRSCDRAFVDVKSASASRDAEGGVAMALRPQSGVGELKLAALDDEAKTFVRLGVQL